MTKKLLNYSVNLQEPISNETRIEIVAKASEAIDTGDVQAMQAWLDKYAEDFRDTAERVRKAMR